MADADVLLQNYRPGKMADLGLDYPELESINPRLIYVSINGVGKNGPMADQKVYDYVIQGLSGAIEAQASDGELQTVRTIIYDKVTALTVAQGITAALYARCQTGVGQLLELSMLDAGLYFNWPDLMWNYTFLGNDIDYAPDLADFYQVSPTNDGAIVSNALGADTSAYDSQVLLDYLAQMEMAASKVNHRSDVIADPQVVANESLEVYVHEVGGEMIQAKSPVNFSRSGKAGRKSSPALGQHSLEVLLGLGYDQSDIEVLLQKGVIS